MRKIYALSGLLAFGLAGLIGWATLGTAQPREPDAGRQVERAAADHRTGPGSAVGHRPVGQPAP